MVVVTGSTRGLGRQHVRTLAAEGASLVVNGRSRRQVNETVEEVRGLGADAVGLAGDAAEWPTGRALVAAAVDRFGRLDALVNNAGTTDDCMVFRMSERQWDTVIATNLKGHAAPVRWVAEHWRAEHRAGRTGRRALVNTTSIAGLFGNVGQSAYAAAKAGIVAMTLGWAHELRKYGVTCNAVAPLARTPGAIATPAIGEVMVSTPGGPFDPWEPANVSPLVAYLVGPSCALSGAVLHVAGREIGVFGGWSLERVVTADGAWTVAEVGRRAEHLGSDGVVAGPGVAPVHDFLRAFADREGGTRR